MAKAFYRIAIRIVFLTELRQVQPDVLEDQTARTVRLHVARRIEEPNSFPFVQKSPKVFGCVDKLLCTASWVARVHRDQAACT